MNHPSSGARCVSRRRRGMAYLLALFVMTVTSVIVVTILDTQVLQYSVVRNTVDYDRARYLAEAGVQHALSVLELDFGRADAAGFDIAATEFPVSSGHTYEVAVGPLLADGTRVVTAAGTAGTFTRRLQLLIKMGG